MEKAAKARSRMVRASPKKTMETCNAVKGMKVDKALSYLEDVLAKRDIVPFKKRNKKMPHRKGGQPGGYPEKSIEKVKGVIQSAVSNAEYQGLDTNNLKIVHATAHRSGSIPGQPKKLRAKSKSLSTIEIVVKEIGG